MTNEMFIGGLMILTLVAGIVFALTSARTSDSKTFDEEKKPRNDHVKRQVNHRS